VDVYLSQDSGVGGTLRTLRLVNMRSHGDVEIFFDLVGSVAPEPEVLDGFVFGIIFFAMQLGGDLRVHGRMTLEALRNLSEFQEAWSSWKPQLYAKVKVLPDEAVDDVPRRGRTEALAAFSGGVDSIFTVLRHAGKELGLASYPLNRAVLMVHGFDVPLDQPEQFESLRNRVRPLLDELNLQALTMRTNLHKLSLQDWEDSCMAQLSCCLHNYAHEFAYGLVGSTEPYNAMVIPWGSNPATDYLLSGNGLRLVHDGAGYTRTEKVAQIARRQTAVRVVKVCWEGEQTGTNCGTCEKCIRTQLNFLAIGVPGAPCFDRPLELDSIATMELRNALQLGEAASVYAYAQKAGISEPWVHALKARIDRYRPVGTVHRLFSLVKRGKWSKIAAALGDRAIRRRRRLAASGRGRPLSKRPGANGGLA
jgi:hypothetical protein